MFLRYGLLSWNFYQAASKSKSPESYYELRITKNKLEMLSDEYNIKLFVKNIHTRLPSTSTDKFIMESIVK